VLCLQLSIPFIHEYHTLIDTQRNIISGCDFSFNYWRNLIEKSFLDQWIFVSLNEISLKHRLINHDSSLEISMIFHGNNSWISTKFVCILFAQYCTCVRNAKKKLGVTDFISEVKRVENYPDFEKLAHIIQHGLQGFIVKNIEGESMEASDLSHIL